ncbi:STAS domain-containing protein [Geodermatophilus sp. SYSU D01106]
MTLELPAGRITLAGELDRETCGHLAAACSMLSAAAAPVWVLDLASLAFFDTAGLHALASSRRAAADAGAVIAVVGARPLLRRLLSMAGLGDVPVEAAHPASAPAATGVGHFDGGVGGRPQTVS